MTGSPRWGVPFIFLFDKKLQLREDAHIAR